MKHNYLFVFILLILMLVIVVMQVGMVRINTILQNYKEVQMMTFSVMIVYLIPAGLFILWYYVDKKRSGVSDEDII